MGGRLGKTFGPNSGPRSFQDRSHSTLASPRILKPIDRIYSDLTNDGTPEPSIDRGVDTCSKGEVEGRGVLDSSNDNTTKRYAFDAFASSTTSHIFSIASALGASLDDGAVKSVLLTPIKRNAGLRRRRPR